MAAPPRRSTYAARRRAARQRARAREVRHVAIDLTPELRALDPMASSYVSSGRATAWIGLAVIAALALHAGVVGVGQWLGSDEEDRDEDSKIAVEVREPPPPPPPPPEPKPVPVPEPPAPRPIAPPPPRDLPPPPVDPIKKPPPRVVGLSFDSTTSGGSGPAFSAGNTTDGKTEKVAVDPRSLVQGAGPVDPPVANQAATRIPSAGASYVLPKRLKPAALPYPETLKAQGIEADVTVMVNIDATGKVTRVKIVKPAPYPEFNEIAERVARSETFEPATRDGAAIPYTLSFTYRFRLEER